MTLMNMYNKYVHTCKSFAGFQSISYNTSRDAPVRFSPVPPALELSKNTAGLKIETEIISTGKIGPLLLLSILPV